MPDPTGQNDDVFIDVIKQIEDSILKLQKTIEGDNIGRILVIEFDDNDSSAFDEVISVLKRYQSFEELKIKDEKAVSLPGLEINPKSRKVYRDRREIHLTTKEYDLLSLLALNKGKVLTYEQIYRKVWGNDAFGILEMRANQSAIIFVICVKSFTKPHQKRHSPFVV